MKEGDRLRLRRCENPDEQVDAVSNQLRKFVEREPMEEVDADSDQYQVRQIMCEAQLPKGRHYLVQWEGFRNKKDWTWEPESSIKVDNPVLRAFCARAEADRKKMPAGKKLPRLTRAQRKVANFLEKVAKVQKTEVKARQESENKGPVEEYKPAGEVEVKSRSGRVVRPNAKYHNGVANMFGVLATIGESELNRGGMV